MSVLSHLDKTASDLLLAKPESGAISTSLTTLATRLKSDSLISDVREQFSFGSWVRDTNLPRRADSYSDVDYMIVFKGDESLKPQTLLDRLKRFVERKYSTSDLKQDHPTMVLLLNHVYIELVPAVRSRNSDFGTLQIPSSGSSYINWQPTYPDQAAKDLAQKNQQNASLIKPLVRILKYWNCLNDSYQSRPFTSFEIEQHAIRQYYSFCNNLKDYFYSAVEGMSVSYYSPQSTKTRIERLKEVVANTKRFEAAQKPYEAENEIKKVIPVFS